MFCHKCKAEKDVNEFHGHKTICYQCNKQRQDDWRIKNREWVNKRQLLTKYKIAESEYDSLLSKQSGHCAICKTESKLHIDHCHGTGKIRGLLCTSCNKAIGLMKDDPIRLQKAIEYLKETVSK